jgi:FtsP/CotA-like multicopper oxidase with cupredoxin domain
LAAGEGLYLVNIAPDDPYGGGVPGDDFDVADPTSTGQVMRFNVAAATGRDNTTPAAELVLPAIVPLVPDPGPALRISLNELESETVCVVEDEDGNVLEADCNIGSPFGPTEAQLGTVGSDGYGIAKTWSDPITENPPVGSTGTWEIYNYTADAHPIHIHLVQFQVLNRQLLATDADGNAIATPIGTPRGPEPWESGFKDTLIVYPGEMARVTAKFNSEGLYVWHCHILEHEDNEMMRPYCVTDTSGSVMADSACAKAGTEAPVVP